MSYFIYKIFINFYAKCKKINFFLKLIWFSRIIKVIWKCFNIYSLIFWVYKFESPIAEIAYVGQKFIIIFRGEILPCKNGITLLRPYAQQVISPYFIGNASALGIVSEHTHPPWFREFAVFIVQILCSRYVLKHRPFLLTSNQRGREYHRVEWNVILTHKLVQTHVLRVFPPLFPIWSIISRYWNVSYRS